MLALNKYFFIPVICLQFFTNNKIEQSTTGTLQITFVNTINGNPLMLDSTYTNPWNEQYSIRKLKYYISNVSVQSDDKNFNEKESYHLIDESNAPSKTFSFDVDEGDYKSISFLTGVDSIKNVSGAQSGALDPLNDMFWTWNSGYIMFKMEGSSPQSTALNNRIEYHIGGFSGENNVVEKVVLTNDKPIEIEKGKTTEIVISAAINKIWQGNYKLKIAETPVCATPGNIAKNIAANYSNMLSIKFIHNN